ncbi:uncharacterized protein LOC131224683 [Magnolia sinica]|uniref:uncharacterized protein LOC131224683 n=1 Tax=Magnolia sinica TaxID=86752 RepID=UPI0026585A51|nr:uncharacterized protein LOC131224683 [Magnolia sinica]
MEVYVDDMLVKSIRVSNHLIDLGETFTVLREYWMKLNPSKCTFGVSSGKFLEFQVNQRGIEANPNKIKALLDMSSPQTVKEIQCLTGRVAALGQFISKAMNKYLPFFQQLKGHKKVEWTSECEQAFQQLKQYLCSPPLLSKPEEGEPLFLYIAVSASAVSSALIREVGEKQHPVYYVSKAMVPIETRHPALEKLTLSLVFSARRLRPYFQAHSVVVLTNSPLKQVLQKPEVSGRLTKWVIELGEFDIQFRPKTTFKGQVVANFIVEFTTPSIEEISIEVEMTLPIPPSDQKAMPEPGWVLNIDGSSNAKRAGAKIVLIALDSTSIQHAIRLSFKASNNEVEYEALLAGLRLAIPRVENSWANALMKLASATEGKISRIIPIEFIEHLSIDQAEKKAVNPVDATPSWMDPIYDYLTSGEVPSDRLEARRLRVRAARYVILDGILYKKEHSQPYLRCLLLDKADYVIWEIHEEICENHSDSRALALKILRQGYFWPTLRKDSKNYVQRIPHTIVLDNGRQFDNDKFRSMCQELSITNAYSLPQHQQSNGQVEAVNKIIKHHLKTKLEKVKGSWAEELPFVLRAYRTTAQS